ncbi:hypothetical protein BH24ACT22_BH24ACT22_15100 [soil metagenome]
MPDPTPSKALSIAGARAASLLESACASALKSNDSLQLDVVRDLAGDLESFLEEASRSETREDPSPDLLAETALRCADLANLAACNVSQLPEGSRSGAIASIHLAAGAVKACEVLAGNETESSGPTNDEGVMRDIRSAGWRTDLAVRQVELP